MGLYADGTKDLITNKEKLITYTINEIFQFFLKVYRFDQI